MLPARPVRFNSEQLNAAIQGDLLLNIFPGSALNHCATYAVINLRFCSFSCSVEDQRYPLMRCSRRNVSSIIYDLQATFSMQKNT